MTDLSFIAGYPGRLRARAEAMQQAGELEPALRERYPGRHDVHSSKALHGYVQAIKAQYLRRSPPLDRVLYDDKLHVIEGALGLHTTATHTHGARVRKRREIRVASLFKSVAPEFLRMIVVHELAHMKHGDHDDDFYRLCEHMEPDYHQLELDLRLWLVATSG